MTISHRAAPFLLALAFAALHFPFLPVSLEDLDSINFALGLRDYNVAEHQPHPPGYPVFILAAKGFDALFGSEARGMSALGIAAGALSAFPLGSLFTRLARDTNRTLAMLAAVMTMTAPLFWLTSARPLSDVVGLAAALGVQAAILAARTDRDILIASAGAGLAAGIRSQVAWLTLPLLGIELLRSRRQILRPAVAAYTAGALLWLVPLIVISGGTTDYWRALSSQGAEDFAGVTMLWTTPTVRQLAYSLRDTFLASWASLALAAAVLVFAGAGSVRLLRHDRRALTTLAVAFGPYLILHLLFQETVTTRYALPLVVPVAYLAVRGAALVGTKGAVAITAALATISLAQAQPALAEYASQPAPVFRMLEDMQFTRLPQAGQEPVLAMHRREAFDLRRPIEWIVQGRPVDVDFLPSPPKHEWLELVKYWNGGGRQPVWFVADPLRSDLALVHHTKARASYRWPFEDVELVGGARPNIMDWYVLDRPAWYLGEGWSLTPETAGVAAEDGKGPGRAPIDGWIRRTPGRATLMIGGRNLVPGGPSARVTVKFDDRPIAEIDAAPGFFFQLVSLEAGQLIGPGDYGRLTVSADRNPVAIEQFDLQPAGIPVFGFGEGWYEHEYDGTTGTRWRWTSNRAALRVRPEGRNLLLSVEGESDPSADNPHVVVRAGDRIVVDEVVSGEFSIDVAIPASLLGGPDPVIFIETDQTHVPADESWGSPDRRELGLKIFDCSLTPVS